MRMGLSTIIFDLLNPLLENVSHHPSQPQYSFIVLIPSPPSIHFVFRMESVFETSGRSSARSLKIPLNDTSEYLLNKKSQKKSPSSSLSVSASSVLFEEYQVELS